MTFCVEDYASIRHLMVYALNAVGFEAAGFPDGTAFWAALKKQQPELTLLDAPGSQRKSGCLAG